MACGGVSGGLFPWKRRSLRPSSVTHGGMQSRNQQLGLIRFQVKGRDSLRLSSTTAVIGNLATTATTKQIGTCKKQTDNFFFFFFSFSSHFSRRDEEEEEEKAGRLAFVFAGTLSRSHGPINAVDWNKKINKINKIKMPAVTFRSDIFQWFSIDFWLFIAAVPLEFPFHLLLIVNYSFNPSGFDSPSHKVMASTLLKDFTRNRLLQWIKLK